ncbi:hypothetical protein Zm00014a_008572 [Zea mays]|nr:Heme oxygenase 1 chloroplastic [Zea mays]PWZ28906.1 hypothetical protein Zm00014a_008572 [Zea mays]
MIGKKVSDAIKSPSMHMHSLLNMIPCAFFLCRYYSALLVSEKILNNKELEFYKWEGNLSQLLQNVRNKLNQVASSWSREEKDHCLEETEKSFSYSGGLLRHIFT